MTAADWHERESIVAEQSSDWFAARWHLDRLMGMRSGEAATECRARRALVLMRLNNLEAAERELALIDKDVARALPRLGQVLRDLADGVAAANGRVAEVAYRCALDIEERLVALHPDDADHRFDLITTLKKFAYFLCRHDRAAEGEPLAVRAVALAEAHLDLGDAQLAYYLDTLAEIYVALGRLADAEPLSRRAVALCVKLPAEDPARAEIAAHHAALLRRRVQPVQASGTAAPSATRR